MTIGVVIPTYNRRDNLLLAIESLAQQTHQAFYLLISDDGSTDGTQEAVNELMNTPTWRDRLIWLEYDPTRDGRRSRAGNRNRGVAHLPPDCTLICFVDSDVVLNEQALAHYALAHARYPEAIIMGLVDWLPPLAYEEVKALVGLGQLDLLREKVPIDISTRMEGTFVGFDIRPRVYPHLFTDTLDMPPGEVFVKCFWTPNLGCPVTVWNKLGGYDEGIVEYGAEDIEFGCQAREQNIPCLHYTPTWGLHVWHPKTDAATVNENIHQNLGYVLGKYGLETFFPTLGQAKASTNARLAPPEGKKQLSDEQKMLLALKLRQKRKKEQKGPS